MGEINMSRFISDTHGFTTSIDVLLFLVMVSFCAILMTPAMIGTSQITTLYSENAAEHNSQTILSSLNGRTDNFYYVVAGTQMDMIVNATLGSGASDSGVYVKCKKLVAGRESNYKILSDLASESAASQFTIFHDNGSSRLNLLTDEYKNNIDIQMQDYLDAQIGDKYRYNLTIIWRPVRGVPVGGETHIGPPVPDTAYVESSWITMPYHTEFTRNHVESLIQKELDAIGVDLVNAKEENKDEIKASIKGHVNNAINNTVDSVVSEIVKRTIKKTIENAQNMVTNQINNAMPGKNSGISDKIGNWIIEELKKDPSLTNDTINETFERLEGELTPFITEYMQELVRQEVHEVVGDEVDILCTDITDLYISGALELDGAKTQVLDYVFSKVCFCKARMTLAIWNKNI
jgi:hypothetical protein